MPDRMSKDKLEDMPGRMPEDMSDRMPEDLPVTKRIDVMVGTTRSKVNHFSYEWDTRVAAPSIAHAIPTGTAALGEKTRSHLPFQEVGSHSVAELVGWGMTEYQRRKDNKDSPAESQRCEYFPCSFYNGQINLYPLI